MAQPLSNNLPLTRHMMFPTTTNTCSVRHLKTPGCVSHDAAQIAGGAACLEVPGVGVPTRCNSQCEMWDKPRKPQLHHLNGLSPQ
jgi:hypothetical protein